MSLKGSLVVVSGFSGVGKGSVMHSLVSRHEGYALSVSATTRDPRPGEKDGEAYFFISTEEFEKMIRQDELVEYACYCDHYYGTPKEFVTRQMKEGKDVLLEIEIQGARKIKARFPDALLVFIMPPSAEELLARLCGRGTESDEVIRQRLERAVREAEGIGDYEYICVNDEIDLCADRMHALIQAQKNLTQRNLEFVSNIREQITDLNQKYHA